LARGQKTFTVKYRYGPKQKRLTIGVYPRVSPSSAREKAIDALREVDEGLAQQIGNSLRIGG